MKRKRSQTKRKNKSVDQFKSFAIAILAVILLVFVAAIIQGNVQAGRNNNALTTSSLMTASAPGSYAFVDGISLGTSWGPIYYSPGVGVPATKIGLTGASPVVAGNYIYAVQYLSNAPSAITQPVRYNIATGAVTVLGTPNAAGDYTNMWRIIDANPDGTYLIGRFSSFSIYNSSGRKLRTISGGMIGVVELSDNSHYVVYNKDEKGYRQAINSSRATKLLSVGYVSDSATNADGSKAAFTSRVGNVDKVYYWNGASTVEIQTANTAAAVNIDMDKIGRVLWAASTGGQDYHIYLYDGLTKDLTPTSSSLPSRWYPASNGTDILYGHGSNLYKGDAVNGFAILGTFPTLVEMVSWGK